jgi:hypothetical protein
MFQTGVSVKKMAGANVPTRTRHSLLLLTITADDLAVSLDYDCHKLHVVLHVLGIRAF